MWSDKTTAIGKKVKETAREGNEREKLEWSYLWIYLFSLKCSISAAFYYISCHLTEVQKTLIRETLMLCVVF